MPVTGSPQLFRESTAIEFYMHGCDGLWCHLYDCIGEAYDTFQLSQIEKITHRIKALLDEDETVKLIQKDGLQKFKKYMEDNDLIRLLPDVVPGYALRHRKWGESSSYAVRVGLKSRAADLI